MKSVLIAGLALAGLVVGCGPKQAPLVNPPSPQVQARAIQANPNMSPVEKQEFLEGLAHSRPPRLPNRAPAGPPK